MLRLSDVHVRFLVCFLVDYYWEADTELEWAMYCTRMYSWEEGSRFCLSGNHWADTGLNRLLAKYFHILMRGCHLENLFLPTVLYDF